jgi:hypothetical protein
MVGAALLLLFGGLVFWFIRRVYLVNYYLPVAADDSSGGRYRLARGVRILLSILHGFAFLAVIAWLPLFLVVTISQYGNPEWGLDVSVYSGFRIDLAALPSVEAIGLRQPDISGRTMVDIDSSNRLALFLFAGSNLIFSIIVLYVVLQLRNIFVTLSTGEAFSTENVSRLTRVGYTVIAGYIAAPFMQYFGWGAVVNDISFSNEGIRLYPAYELNVPGMLIGLGVIVLAGVIKEAVALQDEQRLTV